MKNIQESLRGAVVGGAALLVLGCGDSVFDPREQTFMGCPMQQIFVDETIAGTLTSSDCMFGGAYADMYFLDLRSDRDLLIIDLESFDFDTYLELYDWDTRELVADNDNVTSTNPDARLRGSLPRGRYVISATSSLPNRTGQYILTVD